MRIATIFRAAVLTSLFAFGTVHGQDAPSRPQAPGLGDPGKLTAIQLATGVAADQRTVIRGADSRQQLVVTGSYSSGQTRDLTRLVTYASAPTGIVQIDAAGLVTPLADGEVTITVSGPDGLTATGKLAVENMTHELPVNFPNQIVPVFTKFGCNSGGCHGKASGQNGFKLSLLGFEPKEDFEFLVKEGRGRRLFPAAPERSLLLLKAVNASPHGGGHRIAVDSAEYRTLRRWIAQGMPYGKDEDPTVARIEVFPAGRMMDRKTQQQLVVTAHYTDGRTEDVTQAAQFTANDTEMADVSAGGLVDTLELTGDVAIMARYQGQVAVFSAGIPLGVPVTTLPPEKNFIDAAVFKKLKALGLPASMVADDATFLRRVTVDVAGRLPTIEESQAFLKDANPNKRDAWIEQLLSSTDYADYFANKWSSVLKNKRSQNNTVRANFGFHGWIRDALHQNKPYDQFVREVLAASGDVAQQPSVVWYNEVREINNQVEDAAQLFLGLRIQCARCHHHPFEKWSQHDYYGFSAFFSRVGRKPGSVAGEDRITHKRGVAQAQHPKTGKQIKPTGLGSPELDLAPDQDPRQALVDWMADPKNPFFARALVNRYWKHFFSRGLVDPEDDMRVTNPASNEELLEGLAQHFIKSGYDLKELVRTICRSTTYQLSAEPNEWNQNDKQNFSRFYPRRLNAEVLLDSIDQVTSNTTGFSGLPQGTRAVQLPDTTNGSYFLTVFGKPQGESACECERSSEANLAQSLHLLNSGEIQGKLSSGSARAAKLTQDKERTDEQKITEIYHWVYSRAPVPEELSIALAHIAKHEQNKQIAYEDILWALINTKEFLFNH